MITLTTWLLEPSLRCVTNLLHGCEAEPDVCEEGEGELHAGVEEQVEEVRRADLLQLGQLRGRHRAGQAREPELVL